MSYTTPQPSKPWMDDYYLSKTWKGKREYVLKRDNKRCQYCGAIASQADHVIPRKKGGTDKVQNLVACCKACNKEAGNTLFSSFEEKRSWIRSRRGL